jgi:hypothetical protein
MDAPGVFATTAQDLSTAFVSADGDMEVVQKNGELKLLYKSTAQGHIHCVCGGCAEGVKNHVCNETAVWSPISGNVDFGTLASGNYYLEGDVTVSACSSIKQDVQLNICLNGNDISGTVAIFGYTKAGAVISITDCSGQQGADGIEGEGADVIHTYGLGHKGGAPNQRGKGQQQAAPQLFFIHRKVLLAKKSKIRLPYIISYFFAVFKSKEKRESIKGKIQEFPKKGEKSCKKFS